MPGKWTPGDAQKEDALERGGLLTNGSEFMQWYPCARKYSRSEIVADAVILILGTCFSLVAVPLLIHRSVSKGDEAAKIVGIVIYAVSLFAMFNFSLLFNMLAWSERWFPLVQFCDMCGIYFMIAGTYTPMCLQSNHVLLLSIEWTLAFVGVVWQVLHWGVPQRMRPQLDTFLFMVMGWAIILFGDGIFPYLSQWAMHLIFSFGVIYTAGACIQALEDIPFHKPIWHVCVLCATLATYVLMFWEIAGGSPLGIKYAAAAE